MVERKDVSENQLFIINNILPEPHVKAFQEVADVFHIKIRILASAGQSYTETRLDQDGNNYTYKGIVPEGNLKIRITSSTRNLNSFYDKAGLILAKMITTKKNTKLQ